MGNSEGQEHHGCNNHNHRLGLARARSLWRQPNIIVHADGPHVVAVRCHFPAPTDLHLFDNYDAARAFEAAPCCPTCRHKHTWGNIERFVPPPVPRKQVHWTKLLGDDEDETAA